MINLSIPYSDKRSAVTAYLEILNMVNPSKENRLTKKEKEVLAEFILLEEKYKYYRFSKYAKKKVIERIFERYNRKLTNINLNSTIYSLAQKEYLRRDVDGVLYLKKYLLTSVAELLKSFEINIKFHAEQDRSYN